MWSEFGFTWMPLSKIKSVRAFDWSGGGGSFSVHDVDGREYKMDTLELADASNVDHQRVALQLNDARWREGGAIVPEPRMPDRTTEIARLQARMKKLLPSADRIVFDGFGGETRTLPLALALHSDFKPTGSNWRVVIGGGSWNSDKLALADAKGKRVVVSAAQWTGP
jgi:hypothetical protein